MTEVMYFGKHKGVPVSDVPTRYLMWCHSRLKRCPRPVIQELAKRGKIELPPPPPPRHMGTAVGSDFARLREQFISSGGDVTSCPF